jgi:hypothetical protein
LLLGALTIRTGTIVYGVLVHAGLPIASKAIRILWDLRRGPGDDSMKLLACLCRGRPCLCQEAGRLRIPIGRTLARLLCREKDSIELSSDEIAQMASVTAKQGMKRTPRLLRQLARAGMTIHFTKSTCGNTCPKWRELQLDVPSG